MSLATELLEVRLKREAGSEEEWGFQVVGGSDQGRQLAIQQASILRSE